MGLLWRLDGRVERRLGIRVKYRVYKNLMYKNVIRYG